MFFVALLRGLGTCRHCYTFPVLLDFCAFMSIFVCAQDLQWLWIPNLSEAYLTSLLGKCLDPPPCLSVFLSLPHWFPDYSYHLVFARYYLSTIILLHVNFLLPGILYIVHEEIEYKHAPKKAKSIVVKHSCQINCR